MGPLVWWWRWWLGLDPNQHEQLDEARGMLEEQQTQADELTAQLHARNGEITQLRGQVGTLEDTRAEADELRSKVAELERVEAEAAQLRGQVADLDATRTEADELRARVATLDGELAQARADADRARADADEARGEAAQARVDAEQARDEADELRARIRELESQREAPSAPANAPDLDEAREVLGTRIAVDDLTVIDGIGPKIAELFGAAGIDTWRALADASDEQLREVLADAGPRYRSYDPSPWSEQAAMLADGRWQEFKQATAG
jgi:small subunit ribosomal protein S2